jgi:hypothetical protein
MTMELFIGGPCDGRTLPADASMTQWAVPLETIQQPFKEGEPLFQIAIYRRLHIGHRIVFVHEKMSDERAIDRLLAQYFPPADPN